MKTCVWRLHQLFTQTLDSERGELLLRMEENKLNCGDKWEGNRKVLETSARILGL